MRACVRAWPVYVVRTGAYVWTRVRRFGRHSSYTLVTSDLWDGLMVPKFNDAVSSGAVTYIVAFGAFGRFQDVIVFRSTVLAKSRRNCAKL